MRKIFTVIALSLFSASVFAQPAPSKPEPAKAAEPAKPADAKPPEAAGPPKPAPELTELAKTMSGVWKCEGKFNMGGKEMKDASKASFSPELGGFFVSGRIDGAKSKENPGGFQAKMMISYDAASKTFTRHMFDSWGAVGKDTSKGFEGDVQTWTGKMSMMGMEADSKETITKKGPKEVMIAGSVGAGTPNAMTWETTCKK